MQKIWAFKDNESVETETIDMKQYKGTGKFYDDVETLCRMFGIKVHPALKPPVHEDSQKEGGS
jgi:hypothetical protein